MIEPIEGIKDIKYEDDEPVIKLTPRDGEPREIPDLKMNEETVLEYAKKGDTVFVGVLLETGFDKDLLDVEREVYECQRELKFIDLEIIQCTTQQRLIKEYTDKVLNGEHTSHLKLELFDDFSKLVEHLAQEATDQDISEEMVISRQFRLLKIPFLDRLTLKSEYLQHLQQHHLSLNSNKLSDVPDTLKIKLEELKSKREGVSRKLDEIRLIKREVDSLYFDFNQTQIETFKGLIINAKFIKFEIPPKYTVNDSTIEKILKYKVSPNLVDPDTGETLLHIALGQKNIAMVELLMKRGADPLKVNRVGITPMKMASNMDDSSFIALLLASLKKSNFLADQLKQSYISGLKEFLKELSKAKVMLDTYAETLVSRLGLPKIIRIILFIETRIDSRSKDFDLYFRKLKEACDVLDPQVFFTEVARRAEQAERGMLHQSSLHDPLMKLYLEFIKSHDSLAFTKAKESLIIASAKSAGSPTAKRQTEEIKHTKDENYSLKVKMSLLLDEVQALRSEVKIMKEATNKAKRDNSPRGADDEIKMTVLPVKASASTIFKP